MDPTKPCSACGRPIGQALVVCPYCKIQQPQTITPAQIVGYATFGAAIAGGGLGLVFGWMLAAVGVRWWGYLIGLFLGEPDLGNRWALAMIPYFTGLGGLLLAGTFGIGTFLQTRRYLQEHPSPPWPR